MKRRPALWTLAFPEQVRRTTKGPKKPKGESPRHKAYRRAAKAFLENHPRCEAQWAFKEGAWQFIYQCSLIRLRAQASEVHHKAGRAGSLLLDQSHWLAVCPQCHRRIHDHPKEAIARGNLDPSGWRHKRGPK